MRRAAAVLLVLLALGACGDDGEDVGTRAGGDGTTSPLAGRTFVGGEGLDLVAGTELRLSFTADQMTARAECNTLSGAYATDGGRITVTGLAGTEMGCEPELMDQDTRLAGWFAEPVEVDLDGPTLTLTFSDSTEATLTDEEVATPDVALVGTEWVLDTLIEGETARSVPDGVQATISFSADGSYQLAAGCNSGRGTYAEAGAGTYELEAPALTRRRCDDDAMGVEAAVVTVLDGEVTVSIERDRLTLAATGAGLGFTAG